VIKRNHFLTQCLPSKYKALSSNLSTAKNINEEDPLSRLVKEGLTGKIIHELKSKCQMKPA
jgi:hypothetical protein